MQRQNKFILKKGKYPDLIQENTAQNSNQLILNEIDWYLSVQGMPVKQQAGVRVFFLKIIKQVLAMNRQAKNNWRQSVSQKQTRSVL